MDFGPVPFAIQDLKDRLNFLADLLAKYPNLYVQPTWDGEMFFTRDVNKQVTHFEQVDPMAYNFYLEDEQFKVKIYADPPSVNVFSHTGFEMDWIVEIILDEINPKVLVDLMKKVNSKYLTEPNKKVPYINMWLEKYKNEIL